MRTQILHPSGSRPLNLAINGAMDFWQRIVGAVNTYVAATNAFSADRVFHLTTGPTTKNFTVQRSTVVPAASLVGTPPPYSCQITCNTTVASPAAADRWFAFRYTVEDVDMKEAVQLGYITVAFEFFATTAGTYPCRGYNFASNRSYVTTFQYTTPNVWQQIVIQIPLETGSYHFGFYIEHDGSTFQTGTLNSWLAGDLSTPSGGGFVNLYTSGLVMRLTNLSVFAGRVYPTRNQFYRRGASFAEDFQLCQRYFEKSYAQATAISTPGASEAIRSRAVASDITPSEFKVTKRATPSVAIYSPTTGASNFVRDVSASLDRAVIIGSANDSGFFIDSNPTPSGNAFSYHYTADAEF